VNLRGVGGEHSEEAAIDAELQVADGDPIGDGGVQRGMSRGDLGSLGFSA
jgi:hypothetical protein